MKKIFIPLGISIVIYLLCAGCTPKPAPKYETQIPEDTDTSATSLIFGNHKEGPAGDEKIEFIGTDPDELLSKWSDIGEDSKQLRFSLQADEEGLLLDIYTWYISGVTLDHPGTYKMEMEAGSYAVHGFGGMGLTRMDMQVYALKSETEKNYLDSSIDKAITPLCEFTLENPETVWIEVSPIRFEKDATMAHFCWIIYSQ